MIPGAGVVHLTTVHPRTDTRIWEKEVRSLIAESNRQVVLVVADGKGDGDGIVDIGALHGLRVWKVILGSLRMFRTVRTLRPSVVHFHDPELAPLGFLLQGMGYKVVYDVHEDLPRQIMNKSWIPRPLLHLTAWLAAALEWFGGRVYSAVVAATPTIAERFPQKKTVLVQNFPIIEEFSTSGATPHEQRPRHFVYAGAITQNRGLVQMVDAISRFSEPEVCLLLAGSFRPEGLYTASMDKPAWRHVEFKGWLGRAEVAELYGQVRAGLVVLQRNQNFMDALPVKMFEYMAAGLPVIASDFPLWREIVERAGAGILVDPSDPQAIHAAMRRILDDPAEAVLMGKRGQDAVRGRFNWRPEAEKLIDLYARI